jgi:hypothetical protein
MVDHAGKRGHEPVHNETVILVTGGEAGGSHLTHLPVRVGKFSRAGEVAFARAGV